MQKKIQKLLKDKIKAIEINELKNISSISNLVSLQKNGINQIRVKFIDGTNKDFVLKSKSKNVVKNGINLLSKTNLKLKIRLLFNHKILSYDNSCNREIAIYNNIDESLKKYLINYYGYYVDDSNNTINLLLKYYDNSIEEVSFNTLKRILDDIINFHSFYYDNPYKIKDLKLNVYEKKDYKKAKKCIKELYNSKYNENIKYYGEQRNKDINSFIDNIEQYMIRYSYHRTFTHNDFSTRNMFLNKAEVLFYDFELACYQNPEHDLIELLIYEMENLKDVEIIELIKYYRDKLLKSIEVSINDVEYKEILKFNIYEFIVNRLSLLRIVGDSINIDFIEKLLINSNRLLNIIEV